MSLLLVAAPAGAEVKREKFGDWIKECLEETVKPKRCQLAQTLVDKKGRKIVYFIVARKDDHPYLEVSAPLGILIPAGIAVQIDAQKAVQMRLVDCNPSGCRAVLSLTDEQVNELKKGDAIFARFVDSKSGKRLAIKGSLKGFAEAAKSFGL